MKTYVISAIHGNEVFGLKITSNLQTSNHPNIKTRIAHPEAIAKRTRYIEADLNRSFLAQNRSKEAQIARIIKKDIDKYGPDYIIDIHTSICDIKNIAIAAKLTENIKLLSLRMGMEKLVIMPPSLSKGSLIGCYSNKAVSLEFGRHQRSDKLALSISNNILSLDERLVKTEKSIDVYKVISTIPKSYTGLDRIINLEYNTKLGGYPFLAGSNTYQTIGGFLAKKF